MKDKIFEEGYNKALETLKLCSTPSGFVASPTETNNYFRVWARDGVIVSLAALMTDDKELEKCSLATLRTLKQNQGPHGEIPSNVDPNSGHVSYGGSAGRVDAPLWFVIGVHAYWKKTKDKRFLDEFIKCLRRVEILLGAWEFNTKGLLYVPETGDWSDEFVQSGYILYDQLLYWKALKNLSEMYRYINEVEDETMKKKISNLKTMIKINYWFYKQKQERNGVYTKTIHKNAHQKLKSKPYWMSYFTPTGFSNRFDGFANTLVSLFDIADEDQKKLTDEYLNKKVINTKLKVIPAFYPPVTKEDKVEWKKLKSGHGSSYGYEFKNDPHEYHNGGLWPLISGFYIADLHRRDKTKAKSYLKDLHKANKLDKDSNGWGFYEFINGKTLKPGGTRHQCWSASAAVMGHLAVKGKKVFL